MKQLNVQAIFNSIDGEVNGFNGSGELTTFIRLKGCNLRCVHCDTAYSQDGTAKTWMTLDQIVAWPNILDKVTITGGEPLIQENVSELISLLLELGHRVSVETNGSRLKAPIRPITCFIAFDSLVTNNLRYIVDYKLPSSGMEQHMNSVVFPLLSSTDVIKFVISDEVDYNRAIELIQTRKEWKARKVFSPGFSVNQTDISWPTKLAEKMLQDSDKLQNVQYSLQIHKILWPNATTER